MMIMQNEYSIGEGTTIFFNGEFEIILRKGIWNYEEAILDISIFEKNLQEVVLKIFRALSEGEKITLDDLSDRFGLQSKDVEPVLSLLDELSNQDYIVNKDSDNLKRLIKSLIGGTASMETANEVMKNRNTLLICDSKPVTNQLLSISESISMNILEMNQFDFDKIAKADLTSKVDVLETEESYNDLEQIFIPFNCVLICFQRPHIKFLRNINRILLRLSIPYVLCIIDGPFLSAMTIKGYETGCFECYENRVMARLEDLSAYRKFVDNSSMKMQKFEYSYLTPILAAISLFGLFDAFLINSIHKAKFAGRVLNIYLPLLEIQVQDLLRVPFCSACGHIAKAQYEEMYTSSSKIVEKLVEKVEIVNKTNIEKQ